MRRGREWGEKSPGKVKGALCRLAPWYRSNLSSGSAGENAIALSLYGTGTIWPPCENCSWLGTVGVQLSRWNTLSPSGRTIPSAALTRKEFLYHSSHNKEERERSRAGGRRSEVRGGEGCTVRREEDIVCLWLWATEKHELSGHVWVCLASVFVCDHVWMSELDWVCVEWRMQVHVCEEPSVWDVGAGRPFKGCSNKAGFFFLPLLFEWLLRTGWIPLLMLLRSTLLQGKCGSRKPQTAKTASDQDQHRESLVFDFLLVTDRYGEPCDSEWVLIGIFTTYSE